VTGVGYDELRYYQLMVTDYWGLDTLSSVLSGSYMKIVYTSFIESNKQEIFLMNPDGLGQINLTNQTNNNGYDDKNEYNPIFTPQGDKIVYVLSGENDFEIYIMNLDGSNQTNLTNYTSDNYDSDFHDFNPVVSADGERICFVSFRNNGDKDIFIMNIDGTEQTNLTNSSGSDDTPIFTPDGQKIVFISERDGNKEIYVMDTDGSNPTNLTNNSSYDVLYDNNNVNPVITPDGNSIVFISGRDGDGEVYIMGIDGSNPQNLTNNSYYDFYQQVSPDGNYIVFQSQSAVHVMGIDGSNITNVSNGFGYYPTFSMNSQQVVFTGTDHELYSVNIDGSNPKILTSDGWDKKNPMFRPF
jgi:Tol biopolymer transport system component